MAHRKESRDAARNGHHPAATRRRQARRREATRLNNYLSPRQRAWATRIYKRRLAWYHGPDWQQTGYTGRRFEECANALPSAVLARMKADVFDAYGLTETRWSLSRLLAGGVNENESIVYMVDGLPRYRVTWDRGTMHVERDGKPFASLELESEEQWAIGEASLNPTGTLADAPAGALRILCVCSLGLQTGAVLRHKAERILSGWGVDAWLEVRGLLEARSVAPLADVVLVTRDEEAGARAWGRRTIVVENWVDEAEIAAGLAALPEVQRAGSLTGAATM